MNVSGRDVVIGINAAGTGAMAYYFYTRCQELEKRLQEMEKKMQDTERAVDTNRKKLTATQNSVNTLNGLRASNVSDNQRKFDAIAKTLEEKKLITPQMSQAISPPMVPKAYSPPGTADYISNAMKAFPT